jgi:hypothetical protein
VWRAWSDPDEVMKWWGPQGVTSPRCRLVELQIGEDDLGELLSHVRRDDKRRDIGTSHVGSIRLTQYLHTPDWLELDKLPVLHGGILSISKGVRDSRPGGIAR